MDIQTKIILTEQEGISPHDQRLGPLALVSGSKGLEGRYGEVTILWGPKGTSAIGRWHSSGDEEKPDSKSLEDEDKNDSVSSLSRDVMGSSSSSSSTARRATIER